jgi:hypothetical protein
MNAIQRAIEVLQGCLEHPGADDAIAGLRAMMMQPGPARLDAKHPVIGRCKNHNCFVHEDEGCAAGEFSHIDCSIYSAKGHKTAQQTPAQTAQREPLTTTEIEQLLALWDYHLHGDRARHLVRKAEKAHGITKETP